jgi:peroxiredoxin
MVRFIKSLYAFAIFQLITFPLYSQQVGENGLRTLDGKPVKLSTFNKKQKAIVFLSPECPLSQNYTLVLNQIQEKNQETTVVIGVFPGTAYTPDEYQAFQKKYKIKFPLITDSAKKLVTELGAQVTPEVYLLNEHDQVIYSGAIDNWVIDLGKKRRQTTIHYLSDAITASVQNTSVYPASTKAVGCFILDL